MPSSNFHSAFYVVVGKDGRCSYGWDWSETNKPIEHAIQLSFNDCEEWRIKDNIDGGECKPYDVNTKIVWVRFTAILCNEKNKIYKLLSSYYRHNYTSTHAFIVLQNE